MGKDRYREVLILYENKIKIHSLQKYSNSMFTKVNKSHGSQQSINPYKIIEQVLKEIAEK